MLVNVKSNINDNEIQTLIEYSVIPDPEQLQGVIETYNSSSKHELFGYESEGEIIGIVGFQIDERNQLLLEHLAVKPECRGAKFGRGLILEAILLKKPTAVIAYSYEESVDFFRNIGFTIELIEQSAEFSDQYRCTYEVE